MTRLKTNGVVDSVGEVPEKGRQIFMAMSNTVQYLLVLYIALGFLNRAVLYFYATNGVIQFAVK